VVSTRRPSWPWLLAVLGATLIVGAAIFGFNSIRSAGTGHLDTVPLGEQITFKPSGSYRANIFTPRESSASPAPVCWVTTSDGRPVALHDATPYAVNTRYAMESSHGIHLTTGVTYLITCGHRGEPGSFAVVEISRTAQTTSIVVGSAGATILLVGIASLLIRRRHRPRSRGPASTSLMNRSETIGIASGAIGTASVLIGYLLEAIRQRGDCDLGNKSPDTLGISVLLIVVIGGLAGIAGIVAALIGARHRRRSDVRYLVAGLVLSIASLGGAFAILLVAGHGPSAWFQYCGT
jgi:hypothetical protein